MKQLLLLFILLVFSTCCFSQVVAPAPQSPQIVEEKTIHPDEEPDLSLQKTSKQDFIDGRLYFGYDWEITDNENSAFYYRTTPEKEDEIYRIKDYYRDGSLQMDGTFIDFDGKVPHGTVEYYRPNGTLKTTVVYSNGKAIDINAEKQSLQTIGTKAKVHLNIPFNKTVEEEEGYSLSDLFLNRYDQSFQLDETYYKTIEEGNTIKTIKLSTNEVVSTLYWSETENKPTSGTCKLFNGNHLILELAPSNNIYELRSYYETGSLFFKTTIDEKNEMIYYAPNGTILTNSKNNSGSLLIKDSNLFFLGIDFLTPLKENEPFSIFYMDDGDLLYIDRYYSIDKPMSIYDSTSLTTREFLEDGTMVSEFKSTDPSLFSFSDTRLEGFASWFFDDGSLKLREEYKGLEKISSTYKKGKNTVDCITFYEKESENGLYGEPIKRTYYYDDGVTIRFEEWIENDTYYSKNYDSSGNEIGGFTHKYSIYSSSTLNNIPSEASTKSGFYENTYQINQFTFFSIDEYYGIPTTVYHKVIAEDNVVKQEVLTLNDITFIDYNANGKSSYYNPISGEIIECFYKNGVIENGQEIKFEFERDGIELKEIRSFKNGNKYGYQAIIEDYTNPSYKKEMMLLGEKDIEYTFLGDKKYELDLTSLNGQYAFTSLYQEERFGEITDFTKYINGEYYLANYTNGSLSSIEIYDIEYDDFGSNQQFISKTHEVFYLENEISKIDSFYNPFEPIELGDNFSIHFADNIPFEGTIGNFGYDKYLINYKNGDAEFGVEFTDDVIYEWQDNKFTSKYLLDEAALQSGRYIQIIEQNIDSKSEYVYTAIDPMGKKYSATFEGIQMKSGVFYFYEYGAIKTLIEHNGMIELYDGYLSIEETQNKLPERSISSSSTLEEFRTFYDYYNISYLITPTIGDTTLGEFIN